MCKSGIFRVTQRQVHEFSCSIAVALRTEAPDRRDALIFIKHLLGLDRRLGGTCCLSCVRRHRSQPRRSALASASCEEEVLFACHGIYINNCSGSSAVQEATPLGPLTQFPSPARSALESISDGVCFHYSGVDAPATRNLSPLAPGSAKAAQT